MTIDMLLLALITPVLAASVAKRDPAPATSNLPTGWSYTGCYTDSTSSRSLNAAFTYDNSGLTAQSCIAFCSSKGYPVAGTEYSAECYCGTTVPRVFGDGCNMPCTGDNTQACGGPNRLSVYSNSAAAISVNPGPSGWTSQGCWQDSVQDRVLGYRAPTQGGLSVSQCTTACYNSGFQYAGVEYAAECWCGSSVNGGRPGLNSQCNMVCSGNSSEYCGGSAVLNLYKLNSSPSPTTTSATTLSTTASTTSTTPTTTASAAPTCAAGFSSYGSINNGGFEQGLQYWTTSSNNAVGQSRLYRDTPPYEGCAVLAVSPGTGNGRSFTILSGTTINPGSTRTLSFYVGRRSSNAPVVGASVSFQVAGSSGPAATSGGFGVCSGTSCTVNGSNGSVWRQYSYQINSIARYQLALQMTVSFADGTASTDGSDDVLIDGIVVT